MGAAPSTPGLGKGGAVSPGAAEQIFAALVGDKAYPISEFWRQLLELPLTQQWPRDHVLQVCHAFGFDAAVAGCFFAIETVLRPLKAENAPPFRTAMIILA